MSTVVTCYHCNKKTWHKERDCIILGRKYETKKSENFGIGTRKRYIHYNSNSHSNEDYYEQKLGMKKPGNLKNGKKFCIYYNNINGYLKEECCVNDTKKAAVN